MLAQLIKYANSVEFEVKNKIVRLLFEKFQYRIIKKSKFAYVSYLSFNRTIIYGKNKIFVVLKQFKTYYSRWLLIVL